MREIIAAAVVAVAAGSALAHEGAKHSKKDAAPISMEETAFGREGDPNKVVRTINVDASDKMRFTPSELTIRQGETIRFRVKNSGQTLHEMVLGTMQDLKEHAEMMRKNPGMEHADAFMAHAAPGKTETMVWQFTKPGEFHYGCLVPGHFEAGMIGRIRVVPNQSERSR